MPRNWPLREFGRRAISSAGSIARISSVGLLILLLCAPFLGVAQAIVGSPPIVRYAPSLDVFPQNFAVVQDRRGSVYVGNTDGVLEFDGERWTLIALDNRDIVRSLAVGPDDRIFVGGYNAFGYLRRDETGQARIEYLQQRFAESLGERQFHDIWDILVAPEGVYFRAVRDLFFWDPISDEVRHWRHPGRFGAIAHHQGETLLQFRGEGFRRRTGEQWEKVEGTAALTELVFRLLPLADGSLLCLGVEGIWYRLGPSGLSVAEMPAEMPPSSEFQHALRLFDGSLALAGRDGQIFIVDPTLRVASHFGVDSGFLSGMARANDSGFWAVSDEAVYRIGWPSSWTVLGAEHNTQGDLYDISNWQGGDYLLSSAGVMRVQAVPGGTARVEPLAWGRELVTALHGIDQHRALYATSHKLMLLDDEQSRPISEELVYPRSFYPSAFHPGRVYVGTELGLRWVDQVGEGLRLSAATNGEAELLVSTLVERSAAELWLGTARQGVQRITLDEHGEFASQSAFGPEQGLQLGKIASASVSLLPDGGLLASSRRGLFRWTGDNFVDEDLAGLGALRAPEEHLRVVAAVDGTLWAYSYSRVLRKTGEQPWREQPLRQLRRGAIVNHRLNSDGTAIIVAAQSLLLHSAVAADADEPGPKVRLTEVALSFPDGRRQPLALQPDQPLRLPYGDYGIQFQFALPDMAHADGQAYRGRLVGYEEEFSPWSGSHGYTYSRMSPAIYSLEVQARDGLGRVTAITPYTIEIEAPWYARWWARAIGLLAMIGTLVWLLLRIVRRRTERLAEDKRQLEATVAERTRDLAAANQRLELMAHLDGLTGIANRRRLDQYLASAWISGQQRLRPLALLAIDVDHFKQFNDRNGHLAGDQLLKDLVPLLEQCLRRAEDLLARFGGEEFLVVLPGAELSVAAEIAEAMRTAVAEAHLGATISIGVASWLPQGSDPSELVAAADVALYAAKNGGRNRVVLSQSSGPELD